MKLNHLNLTVTDVQASKAFLTKYFGLRGMENFAGNDAFTILLDDDGFVLTLMKPGQQSEVKYPSSFHVGFRQENEERVNEINQQLKDDGFTVSPPRKFHGSWTFYMQAPGEFTVEVLC